jgi:hypothetical protein
MRLGRVRPARPADYGDAKFFAGLARGFDLGLSIANQRDDFFNLFLA